ncbi:MAG TPA: TonB family protein [Vicinamibacterales bacterium]|nr:TonB family protein [Vicinamibacterales bacterium]
MDVTDVLRDRMHQPGGLQGMVTLSLILHGALIAGILLAPGAWMARQAEPQRNVMTIALSGAGEGVRKGGLTPAASQTVQTAVPPEQLPKRETPQAPAAKTPDMTIPKTNARQVKRAQVDEAPPDAKARLVPNRGAQTSTGPAIANTPRGQGFGLSNGGGPGTGSWLDVGDFCCPDYIVTMVERIRSVWAQNQGATGVCVVRFTIQRSGQISEASVEKSSGTASLDLAALRAVLQTKSLPQLPDQFTDRTLPVHLSFEYR